MEPGVLESYRTLGLTCDTKPFKWHREADHILLTFPLGKSYLSYTLESLQIRYIGPQLLETANSIDSYKDQILVATGNTVSAFHKIKLVKTFKSESSISEILVFGNYLIGLTFKAELITWDCDTTEQISSINLSQKGLHLLHPPTYLNKVLISLKKGKILLVNVKTGNKIYDFPNICKEINGEITALEHAVALDTVAIGVESGRIMLVNILTDSVLFTFDQGEKVTSLSISSFGECNILASSSHTGMIYLWNLQEKKIQGKVKAHFGFEIDRVFFVPGEMRIVSSSGTENSIKQWVFDFESDVPRVNKSREGFNKPPKMVRFYNENHVLAIAENGVRDLSLLNEHQSATFSSKNVKPVIKQGSGVFKILGFDEFAFSENREKDWTNLLSLNGGEAFLWNYENKAIGEKKIERKNKAKISAVGVSECGNFGVLGYASGSIEKFSMQSGLNQLLFNKSHNSSVTSLCLDSTNSILISSSLSGEIFLFDFFSGALKSTLTINEPINKMRLQSFSNLLGVLTDSSCLIYDIRTLNLSRSFTIQSPSDLSFSSDSRWLGIIENNNIQIWDLPNIKLIDWVTFKHKPLSLDFSPDGRYLATTHESSLGVFLWLNKSFYTQTLINKSPSSARFIKGFDVSKGKNFYSKKHIKIADILSEPVESKAENLIQLKFPKGIEHQALVTSNLPSSRIAALYNWDEIKDRNAPIEPPKKPEKVPFFLPDSLGIVKYDLESGKNEGKVEKVKEKEVELSSMVNGDLNVDSVLEFLKGLSPGRIELNIYGLGVEEVEKFVEVLKKCVEDLKDFEFVQSVLACFLKIHSDGISKEQVKMLLGVQEKAWRKIEEELLFDISGLERLLD